MLFVGTSEAGKNVAILQSIIATSKLQNVNPRPYLEDVLVHIQTHPAARTDELLSANWIRTETSQPSVTLGQNP